MIVSFICLQVKLSYMSGIFYFHSLSYDILLLLEKAVFLRQNSNHFKVIAENLYSDSKGIRINLICYGLLFTWHTVWHLLEIFPFQGIQAKTRMHDNGFWQGFTIHNSPKSQTSSATWWSWFFLQLGMFLC